MTTPTDYTVCGFSDGIVTLGLSPPTAIGGMTIRYQLMKRPGGTPIVEAWVGSGRNGTSGITITNSGQGIMNITLDSAKMSGRDPGNYYFECDRVDAGSRTRITDGYQTTNQ